MGDPGRYRPAGRAPSVQELTVWDKFMGIGSGAAGGMCPAEPQHCGDPGLRAGGYSNLAPPKNPPSTLAGLWGHQPPTPKTGSKGTLLGRSAFRGERRNPKASRLGAEPAPAALWGGSHSGLGCKINRKALGSRACAGAAGPPAGGSGGGLCKAGRAGQRERAHLAAGVHGGAEAGAGSGAGAGAGAERAAGPGRCAGRGTRSRAGRRRGRRPGIGAA